MHLLPLLPQVISQPSEPQLAAKKLDASILNIVNCKFQKDDMLYSLLVLDILHGVVTLRSQDEVCWDELCALMQQLVE